jgi:transcription elongation factor Elf1
MPEVNCPMCGGALAVVKKGVTHDHYICEACKLHNYTKAGNLNIIATYAEDDEK